MSLVAANVRLGLGNGTTDFVVVENGYGTLLITPAGVAGAIMATVRVRD